VVGEWMPLTVFTLAQGRLSDNTGAFFARKYHGWWNKLLVGDFNGDKRPDLVVGNLGLNAQCRASDRQPAELVYKDFDDNGSVDPMLCFYIQGKSYPYVTRDELLDQISVMRSRFPDYASYADATLKDIFTAEELQGAKRLFANQLETSYFEGSASGRLVQKALPLAAQVAPVYALAALDYNQDGKQDLVLAGNMNQARLRFGKYDANYGLLLQGDGKGQFRQVPQHQSGLGLKGDVRSVLQIQNTLVFGINGQGLKAYKRK
jgi:enediyne biosynthesis protein E4